MLSACSPSAETQDKKACQDYSDAVVAWTNAGGGELAAGGVESALSSKAIPEASTSLAKDMKVIAKLFGDYQGENYTTAQLAASSRVGKRCAAVGAPLSTD